MTTESRDVLRLGVQEAYDLIVSSLRKGGYDEEETEMIAGHLMDSALSGYRHIAFPRLMEMVQNARKHPNRKVETIRLTPFSARVNGGFESGYISHYRATELAIEIARQHRFALVGVNDSISSGRSAYYMERIAKAGLIGILFTGGQTQVAPHGGIVPLFGTNPIAFGFPAEPETIVFDMATSATNGGDVRLARRLNELLPEGVVVDERGSPTRDPHAANAILPFGGHKGYGLSFVVQLMGDLGGAPLDRDGKRGWGSLFVVFDPELLMPLADFKAYAARLVAEIKAGPRREGFDEILIPSERSYRERARRRREGVDIDRKIYDELLELE